MVGGSSTITSALPKIVRGHWDPRDLDYGTCGGRIPHHPFFFLMCIAGLQTAQILEPVCGFAAPRPAMAREALGKVRFLVEQIFRDDPPAPVVPELGCRVYGYTLAPKWINDESVQKALHIRKGTIGTWQRCSYGLPYTNEVSSSLHYHVNLSERGLRSLIYSGDHDMIIPFLGTQAWIRSLNYSIVDEWRPWVVEGQVGGYTRSYANQMTFATVKGGGHTAPEYKPKESLAMYGRWISNEPL